MELEKKQIHCLRIGKKITDQIYLDEDYNVPDVKDDVRKIVHGKAEIRPLLDPGRHTEGGAD